MRQNRSSYKDLRKIKISIGLKHAKKMVMEVIEIMSLGIRLTNNSIKSSNSIGMI